MDSLAKVVTWIRTLLDSELLTLGTDYKVKLSKENILGEGGFGVVWHGKNSRTNEHVAVKQVQRKPETEIFCERELNFMRVCKHKNILTLIDFMADDSSFFFVLEYCAAGNLDNVAKKRDIDLRTCSSYMLDITVGLQFMHQKNIGHRDLKPTNVVVKNDRCLKISDFGLSRELFADSSASASDGVGSAPWMAPELSAAKRPDASTGNNATTSTAKQATRRTKYSLAIDIFSLGLLFLSLLTHQKGRHLCAHTGM